VDAQLATIGAGDKTAIAQERLLPSLLGTLASVAVQKFYK